MRPEPKFVYGIDLSLNHFGIVGLDIETGVVNEYHFMSNIKKYMQHKRDKKKVSGFYLPPRKVKEEHRESYNYKRLKNIFDAIHEINWPYGSYIAVEDYAYATITNSAYQIGEAGGLVRSVLLLSFNCRLRLIDPMSLQMWVYKGGPSCTKKVRIIKAREMGFAIPDYLVDKKKKDWDGPGTDLADAFHLADLLRTELKIRNGSMLMNELPENRIRVFNRITKAHPENILSMDLISIKYKGVINESA